MAFSFLPSNRAEIGPGLFGNACEFLAWAPVLEHVERAYRAGRCNHWFKVKKPKHPASKRVQDQS